MHLCLALATCWEAHDLCLALAVCWDAHASLPSFSCMLAWSCIFAYLEPHVGMLSQALATCWDAHASLPTLSYMLGCSCIFAYLEPHVGMLKHLCIATLLRVETSFLLGMLVHFARHYPWG